MSGQGSVSDGKDVDGKVDGSVGRSSKRQKTAEEVEEEKKKRNERVRKKRQLNSQLNVGASSSSVGDNLENGSSSNTKNDESVNEDANQSMPTSSLSLVIRSDEMDSAKVEHGKSIDKRSGTQSNGSSAASTPARTMVTRSQSRAGTPQRQTSASPLHGKQGMMLASPLVSRGRVRHSDISAENLYEDKKTRVRSVTPLSNGSSTTSTPARTMVTRLQSRAGTPQIVVTSNSLSSLHKRASSMPALIGIPSISSGGSIFNLDASNSSAKIDNEGKKVGKRSVTPRSNVSSAASTPARTMVTRSQSRSGTPQLEIQSLSVPNSASSILPDAADSSSSVCTQSSVGKSNVQMRSQQRVLHDKTILSKGSDVSLSNVMKSKAMKSVKVKAIRSKKSSKVGLTSTASNSVGDSSGTGVRQFTEEERRRRVEQAVREHQQNMLSYAANCAKDGISINAKQFGLIPHSTIDSSEFAKERKEVEERHKISKIPKIRLKDVNLDQSMSESSAEEAGPSTASTQTKVVGRKREVQKRKIQFDPNEAGPSQPKRQYVLNDHSTKRRSKVTRSIGDDEGHWLQKVRGQGKQSRKKTAHQDKREDNSVMKVRNKNPGVLRGENIVAVGPDQLKLIAERRSYQLSKSMKERLPMKELNKKRLSTIDPKNKNFNDIEHAYPNKSLDLGERMVCRHCKALTYTWNCCGDGKVKIPPPLRQPKMLRDYFTGDRPADRHVQKNIVSYNNAFGLGSISYVRQTEPGSEPFMKVNGQMHHAVSNARTAQKDDGEWCPMFHQLYKLDVNEATHYRVKNPITGAKVRPNILRNIHMLLEEKNHLIRQYKTAHEVQADMVKKGRQLKNVYVVLHSPSEINFKGAFHPGTLTRANEEINSMIYTMENDGGPPKHGIYIVHRQFGGNLELLGYWNPLQDPIGYPLLFPYGNAGYKRKQYRLNEDYTTDRAEEERMLDLMDEMDPYPCEDLDDDMETAEILVDYDAARKNYKEYWKSTGEDVSDEEEEDEVIEDEGIVEEPLLLQESDGEEEERLCEEQVETIPLLDDDELFAGKHHFLQDSEDEGEDDARHNSHDSKMKAEEEAERKKRQAERALEMERRRKEEELIVQKTLRREERAMKKYFKVQEFKKKCMLMTDEQMRNFFRDEEMPKVSVDIAFLRRKTERRRAHIFKLAIDIFDMDPEYVVNVYNTDTALDRLEMDLQFEIAEIYFNPHHREKDPKIKHFRQNQLCLQLQDDNMADEAEDIGDLVQREVGIDESVKDKKKYKGPVQNIGNRKYVSRREHALHQLQTRDPDYHPYLSTMMLGQLYVIDLALRYIRQRNDTQREHLISLRRTNETALFKKHQRVARRKGYSLGYSFQLPSTRVQSTAWYRREFENAMAVVDRTGKPDLFITMTGNPEWAEITRNKFKHSTWQSNMFMVNEVFYVKMQELLRDIIELELFGPVISYCYSIEFQKRGMPHMHLLVTLKEGYKLDTSDKIDQFISAKIPEEPTRDDPFYEKKMEFRKNVCQFMVHNACINNKNAMCMQRPDNPDRAAQHVYTRCTKYFPMSFNTHTTTINGGKVEYHRPNDNVTYVKKMDHKDDIVADNRYVVPYCPMLLNKYRCHINVEAISTVDVIKYIYKYIYKGFDKALASFIEASSVDNGNVGKPPPISIKKIKKGGDAATLMPLSVNPSSRQIRDMSKRIAGVLREKNVEAKDGEKLTAYDEAIIVEVFRQMTASEAAWILQGFCISGNPYTVINIGTHEEGDMPVFIRCNEDEKMKERIESGSYKSQLVAWFDLNKEDRFARQFTYDEIPLHYRWVKTATKCAWERYKTRRWKNIVRVYPVSPRFLQAFATRLLAMNQRGCTSFEDLRTVDGILYSTPHDAAKAAGLMNSQLEFEVAIAEAAKMQTPKYLREMFAIILLYGECTNPIKLWEMFKTDFFDRYLEKTPRKAAAAALYHIQYILSQMSRDLKDFALPEVDLSLLGILDKAKALGEDTAPAKVDVEVEAKKLELLLNDEQKAAYDTVLRAVSMNGRHDSPTCFFLQGSGGCGKTFVYRALYYRLQTKNISVAMIATTGIAATLLINGMTAHRKFSVPVDTTATSPSTITSDSKAAEHLRQTTVFIIDEATMASCHVYACIDRLLRDITGVFNKPFGGKILLLGGDWKQLLPVVPGGSSNEAILHTLKAHQLWKNFNILTLTRNMRAAQDPKYAQLLENVGNGMVNGVPNNIVRLEPNCFVKREEDVINFIYKDMKVDPLELAKSCILTSLNKETNEVNAKVLDRLNGTSVCYKAIDTPKDGIGMQVSPEYWEDDMPSGMPPHKLHLKVGAIVILLRNLNVKDGLCNGSRLQIMELKKTFVVCKLISTDCIGSIHYISKLALSPASNGKKNANYTRFQLPLRLAYAMTINKSQGQTFEKVGIILKNNVFAHGQLYVALSRARESSKVCVYSASHIEHEDRPMIIMRNKVERQILEDIGEPPQIDDDYKDPQPVYAKKWHQAGRTTKRKRNAPDHSKSYYIDLIKRKKLQRQMNFEEYVEETRLRYKFTSSSDVSKETANKHYCFFVFCVSAANPLMPQEIGVISQDGIPLSLAVIPELRHPRWNEIISGQIISFYGCTGRWELPKNRIWIVAASPPIILNQRLTIVPRDLPDGPLPKFYKTAIVMEVGKILRRSKKTKTPVQMRCYSVSGTPYLIESSVKQHIDLLDTISTGTMLRVAPVEVQSKIGSKYVVFECYDGTAIELLSGQSNEIESANDRKRKTQPGIMERMLDRIVARNAQSDSESDDDDDDDDGGGEERVNADVGGENVVTKGITVPNQPIVRRRQSAPRTLAGILGTENQIVLEEQDVDATADTPSAQHLNRQPIRKKDVQLPNMSELSVRQSVRLACKRSLTDS